MASLTALAALHGSRARPQSRRGRGWLVLRLLVLADLVGLGAAFFAAQALFPPAAAASDAVSPGLESLVFVLALPVWVGTAQLSGLYGRDDLRANHSTADDLVGIAAVVTVGTWLFWAGASLTHVLTPHVPRMVAFWAMAIVFVVAARTLARAVARRSRLYVQRALIVGAGETGQLLAHKLSQHPEYKIELAGFVGEKPERWRDDLPTLELLGPLERAQELIVSHEIDRVVVAFPEVAHARLLELIHRLRASSVQIDLVPRLYEVVGPKVDLHTIEAVPLIGLPPSRLSPAARVTKRSLDVLVAGAGLVLTAPLLVYLALRIRLDSEGPVLFRQTRLGLNMREFTALKFRTMRVDSDDAPHREYIRATMAKDAVADARGLYKLDRVDSVTPFGRFLRRTSLDELPQLINVLKGDMSLVGPRPCIPYETEHFAPHHFERFLVPPGMTGLWQVTARARSSFGEALEMDVAYARGWTLGLDLRLLCRTPLALLRQTTTA